MKNMILRLLKSENGPSTTTYAAILGTIAIGYVVACRLLLS